MRRLVLVALVLLLAGGAVHLVLRRSAGDAPTVPVDAAEATGAQGEQDIRLEGAGESSLPSAGASQATGETRADASIWGDDLAFVVVDKETQKPISGALVRTRVQAPAHAGSHAGGLERETRTDANGVARLPSCRERAEIAIRKEGYLTTWFTPWEASEETRIELWPGTPFRGRVLDGDGHVVVGAHVYVEANLIRFTRIDLVQRTDEDGRFVVAGLLGPPFLHLHVSHPGYGSLLVEHLALEETAKELVIVLGEGAVVTGTVEDEAGLGVPHAEVFVGDRTVSRLLRMERWEIERSAMLRTRAVTDASGRFVLRGVPSPGECVACARAPDGREGESRLFTVSDASTRREIVIPVHAVGSIAVSYVDAETGHALEAADVHCTVDAPGREARFDPRAGTDRRTNRDRLGGLRPGTYRVHAWPGGTHLAPPPVNVEVRGGEETSIEFAIESGRTVKGRVVDEDGEARHAIVFFESTWRGTRQTTEVQRFGEFELDAVGPGKGRLTALGIPDEQRRVWEDVVLDDDLGDLVLPRGPTVVGRLPPGTEADDVIMHVQTEESDWGTHMLFLDDGAFLLNDLPTGVAVDLILSTPKTPPFVLRGLVLAPGEERDLGVIAFPTATPLEGRLIDHKGEPVARALLRAVHPLAPDRTHTDVEGRFRLTRLLAGPVTLGVWAPGSRFGSERLLGFSAVEVREGSEPVTLRLPQPGRLRLRVVREDGDPLPLARVYCAPEDEGGFPDWHLSSTLNADAHGRLDAELPPGRWWITIRRQHEGDVIGEAARIEIRRGETTVEEVTVR